MRLDELLASLVENEIKELDEQRNPHPIGILRCKFSWYIVKLSAVTYGILDESGNQIYTAIGRCQLAEFLRGKIDA